jgi:tRNA nucleotidyltransferase (CCA-adding enzyme)
MSNIADALRSTMGAAQLDVARRVAGACRELGCQAYIVGGTVRDAFLGSPAADLDVTVVSPTTDILERVAATMDATVVMVSQFGTAKLEIEGSTLDLVIARSERYGFPGALPDVKSGSLDDDLARRDFTINSMAASLDPDGWGEIIDPYGGQLDLKQGLVRTLHEQSFPDDATRILRAARYASRFGFRLEDGTARQLQQSVGFLDSISPERFKQELERVFDEPTVVGAMKLLSTWDALNSAAGAFSFDETAWSSLAESCPVGSLERRIVGWGLLAIGFQALRRSEIAVRWKLDATARKTVTETLNLQDRLRSMSLDDLTPSGRVAMLEKFSDYAAITVMLSASENSTRAALADYLTTLKAMTPLLDGRDVLALGVPQGPHVGEVLQMLKDARLDREVSSRSEETLLVSRYVSRLDK